MAKRGMPTQGTKALMSAWSDANETVIKSGKKNRTRTPAKKGKKA